MENMILPTTFFFRQPQKSQSQIRPCQIEIIFVEYLSISLKNRRQIVVVSWSYSNRMQQVPSCIELTFPNE